MGQIESGALWGVVVSSHSVFRAWYSLLIPLLVVRFDAGWEAEWRVRLHISSVISELFQIVFALIFCETSVKEEREKRKQECAA